MDATQTPEPPPEGELIRQAMKARRLNARKVAPQAGVSDTWLRNIVRGYQVSGGTRVIARANAETLARIARVVGVTPSQLREVDREDAAEEFEYLEQVEEQERLKEQERQEEQERLAVTPNVASGSLSPASDPRVAAIATLLADLSPEAREEVLRRVSQQTSTPRQNPDGQHHIGQHRHAG